MTIKSLELIHQLLEGYLKTTYDAHTAAERDFQQQCKGAPDDQYPKRPDSLRRLGEQLNLAQTALLDFEEEACT